MPLMTCSGAIRSNFAISPAVELKEAGASAWFPTTELGLEVLPTPTEYPTSVHD